MAQEQDQVPHGKYLEEQGLYLGEKPLSGKLFIKQLTNYGPKYSTTFELFSRSKKQESITGFLLHR